MNTAPAGHGHLDTIAAAMRAGVETAAGLLFPPYCMGCQKSNTASGQWLCEGCAAGARSIRAPFCAVCSEAFEGVMGGQPFSCANCRDREFAFTCAVARRRARGLVRDLIARFKYQGQFYLRQPLCAWLLEAFEDERLKIGPVPEALVPVPLHPRRQRERGYNQALVLARLAGRQLGVPVVEGVLRRVRWTETQTHFSRKQRMKNLAGAFSVRERGREAIHGRRLVLIDDVFTTGSTVDECARVLLAAGAAGVRVATVARR